MTPALLKKLFPNASQACIARNIGAVGAMETHGPEPAKTSTLDSRPQKQGRGKAGVVYRVSLVAVRKRLLDPDAVAFACKPLTDAIAMTLGLDDADPRLVFEYSQTETKGAEGVLVKIEAV